LKVRDHIEEESSGCQIASHQVAMITNKRCICND
jgi:hypothetical protein